MGADAKTGMKVGDGSGGQADSGNCRQGSRQECVACLRRGRRCSGFSYKFDLVGDRNDDDVAVEKNGATVLIDELSLVYMGGSVIDFVDDLMGQSFQIRNPNAVASCGCGTSFSI